LVECLFQMEDNSHPEITQEISIMEQKQVCLLMTLSFSKH
jgi:hypothetical protein